MGKTIIFNNKPKIISTYSVAGPKESLSYINDYFDCKIDDDFFQEKTFEKAETKMLYRCILGIFEKNKLNDKDIDVILSGDLLNQITASSFSIRNFDCSYLGIYNACATFAESIIIGSMGVDGGYLKNCICATSSHFSSAERQYRYPLELGSTRPPLSQWTVTGAGSVLIDRSEIGININSATIGKIVDFGIKDANNMGSAMAPSAVDTLVSHFKTTGTKPRDYDLIVTGDLGTFGSRIFKDLCWERGYDVENQHIDCGEIIYNIKEEEFQGGSGAGCSSLVFSSYIYRNILEGKLKRVLLICTGALLSSTTTLQGESIPGISHLVDIGG
ncbi:MAG: stage V sporulation protein AD [Firmicutes bacterium]|nr:stage V sporulation protein AD [Candidatus Caballimonas caccae]